MKEYLITIPTPEKSEPFYISLAGITYEDPLYKIQRANSPIYNIEYVISGKGWIEIDNRIIEVNSGDMYMLPEGIKHTYYSDSINPWRKIWFNGCGHLYEQLIVLYGLKNIYHFPNLNGYNVLNKLISICADKSLSVDEINRKGTLIFTEIILMMYKHKNSETKISSDAIILKNYIDAHPKENISIKTLSKLIFKSESQTNRIFKKNFSITPYEYILNNKISRAKLILQNSNISIKEISFMLGFSDEHYFSNIFKKKTGISPSAYKKK